MIEEVHPIDSHLDLILQDLIKHQNWVATVGFCYQQDQVFLNSPIWEMH